MARKTKVEVKAKKVSEAEKIRNMDVATIEKNIEELKQELFNLRFQQATGIIEKPSRIKELRHDVARCKTVLRERELEVK